METWWLSAVKGEDGTWQDADGSHSISEQMLDSSECLELVCVQNTRISELDS